MNLTNADREAIDRRQDGGLTNPVEPTIVEDLPTSSRTINFSSLQPQTGDDDTDQSSGSSSEPTFFAQTTFPPLTGTDFITITGTNTESVSDADESGSKSVSEATSTVTSSTTRSQETTTAGAEGTEMTQTEDAAPTAAPGKAVAGLAAALALVAVL
jgi:hypothetical protein